MQKTFTVDVLAKQWLVMNGFTFDRFTVGTESLWWSVKQQKRAFLRRQPIMQGGGWYVDIDP